MTHVCIKCYLFIKAFIIAQITNELYEKKILSIQNTFSALV